MITMRFYGYKSQSQYRIINIHNCLDAALHPKNILYISIFEGKPFWKQCKMINVKFFHAID